MPGLGQTSLSLILLLDQCLLAAGLSLCFQHYVELKVKTRADPADQLLAAALTPRKMHLRIQTSMGNTPPGCLTGKLGTEMLCECVT